MPARSDCSTTKAAFAPGALPLDGDRRTTSKFPRCCLACHQDADGLADHRRGRALLSFLVGPSVRCRGKRVRLKAMVCCKVRNWLLLNHPAGKMNASKLRLLGRAPADGD